VRAPDFEGAHDRSTEASLLGPFDGQVVDGSTTEPISGATVLAIWTYDEGRGFVGAGGSVTRSFVTDAAGRYKIPAESPRRGAGTRRLVSFELIVYKRGYVGYRSDVGFEDERRPDFVQRHHRIALRKWRDTDSHADHLAYLRPPPELQPLVAWEERAANLDLYEAKTADADGAGARPTETSGTPSEAESKALALLDARTLLPPDEVKRRTGSATTFQVKDLTDLARTHFYHGVHLQAVTQDEEWDVAYRVWKAPPAGLESIEETFAASLPGVQASDDIVEPTWIYDSGEVRAVAFIDRPREIGVLLTCGPAQCIDVETALILAKFIYNRLDQLRTEPSP